MSIKSGKSIELWGEAERVAAAGEVVMLAKAGGNLAVLRWDKYESLIASAVAQEAARWREAAQKEVHQNSFCCDDNNHAADCSSRLLMDLLHSSSSDWLAAHDSEVLRPWREALSELVDHPTVSGMSCNIRDDARRNGKIDPYEQAKALLAAAGIIVPAPATKEEKA